MSLVSRAQEGLFTLFGQSADIKFAFEMKVLAGPASYKQQIKNFKATLVATSTTFVAAEDRGMKREMDE